MARSSEPEREDIQALGHSAEVIIGLFDKTGFLREDSGSSIAALHAPALAVQPVSLLEIGGYPYSRNELAADLRTSVNVVDRLLPERDAGVLEGSSLRQSFVLVCQKPQAAG